MAFKEISSADHGLLLYRIDCLPYDETQEITAALLKMHVEYLDQLFRLQNCAGTMRSLLTASVQGCLKGQ